MPLRDRQLRSQRGVSELSQVPLVLYVLFVIVLLPLLNLVNLLVAGATQYLATNDSAAKAATQADYPGALTNMLNEAYQFQSTGLAKFVNMEPDGGYIGCGNDLYVIATNLGSGAVTSSPADRPLTQPIDTKASMYELQVKSIYSVSPLISLAAVPVLGNVPGLGKPVTFTFTANRPVEHPGGLQTQAQANNGKGAVVIPFARVAGDPANSAPPSNSTWRTPDIFKRIQNAGQTVVSVTVVNVPSDLGSTSKSGGWVPTGVVVGAGQTVWLDTQAQGTWGNLAMPNTWDANGLAGTANNPCSIDLDLPNQMLIGYVGKAPVLPYGFSNNTLSGDPHFIPSGDSLFNFPLVYTGPISLACNDDQLSDTGLQQVRVIITQ